MKQPGNNVGHIMLIETCRMSWIEIEFLLWLKPAVMVLLTFLASLCLNSGEETGCWWDGFSYLLW